MSVRVFITYKLKPTTTIEQYREWSRTMDQPIASKAPGVLRYEIFEVRGAGKGPIDFDIIEDIEAESWEAWLRVNTLDDLKPVVRRWLDLCDENSVRVHWGEKLEP